MQNPSALYRFETDADLTVLRPGVLVVALGAFIDAGQIQRSSVATSSRPATREVVASFDVDQLLDYRGRRPAMVFDTNRWVELRRPGDAAAPRSPTATGRPLPAHRPRARLPVGARRRGDPRARRALGVTLVVHTHGIPMARAAHPPGRHDRPRHQRRAHR